MNVQQQMDGGADSLEVRIIHALYGERDGAFTVDMKKVEALKQLFREWAESCVPEAKTAATVTVTYNDSPSERETHSNREHAEAFNDCRTQTIKNIQADVKGKESA